MFLINFYVEVYQYCSTYQSVPLFCLSWEKVEMKTEKSLPKITYVFFFQGLGCHIEHDSEKNVLKFKVKNVVLN